MEMEEELSDFKSRIAKFQAAGRSTTLPANYSKPQHDQISTTNISNVRSNPALQDVISILESQVKPVPPIANKPAVVSKPVGFSNVANPPLASAPSALKPPVALRDKLPEESDSMKSNNFFRKTVHIMDNSRTEGDGACESLPQFYRVSWPNLPEQRATQPAVQDCYEVVGPDLWSMAASSPVTNDPIKSAHSSSSMSCKDRGRPSPSNDLSPKKADIPPKLGGDDKGKPYCVNKTPELKSLPSIDSQGPPPPKYPRPPKVDLSTFLRGSHQDRPRKGHEEAPGPVYELPPPSPDPVDEGECYEDAFNFNESAESGSNVYEVEAVYHDTLGVEESEPFVTSLQEMDSELYAGVLKVSEKENLYELEEASTLSDPDHTEYSYYEVSEADKELGSSSTVMGTYPSFTSSVSEGYHSAGESETEIRSGARRETYTKKTKTRNGENGLLKEFQISGQENAIYTAMILDGFKPEKYTLPVNKGDMVQIIRITDCPKGKWLAQDKSGSYGYVPVSCVETSKDVLNFHNLPSSLSPIIPDITTRTHDGGAGADLYMRSDSFSTSSSDTYDDVGNSNVATSNIGGKSKRLGNLFRKDKGRKYDLGSGYRRPNLTATSQEGAENSTYDDISTPQQKKLNAPGVLKKFAKEEKNFREKFKYTGDINVVNVATVNDLAPLSTKEKLDLAVRAGETVEIIDGIDEEKIICRNLAGKYGYVRIEYLTFKTEHFQ